MTSLQLHVPSTDEPIRIGRVWTATEEFVWTSHGWTSEQDPETADLLTKGGYGAETNSALADAYDNVLKHVAGFLDNARWECFLPSSSGLQIN